MGVSVCVIAGIGLVGFCVSRLKARRGARQNVQTLFSGRK